MSHSLNLEEVLRLILTEALKAVGGKIGWISLLEDGRLKTSVVEGIDPELVKKELELGEGITGIAAETRQYFYASDVSQMDEYYQVSDKIKSELAVPLVAYHKVLGVLNIESTRKDAFSRSDQKLLSTFADEAAVAVQNAMNFDRVNRSQVHLNRELEEKVKNFKVLSDIFSAINSSLDLDKVLNLIITRTLEVFPADMCQLLLHDSDKKVLKVFNPSPEQLEEGSHLEIRMDEGVTGWVARQRMPVIIPDVTKDKRYVQFRSETRSEMAVPLIKNRHLIGVINIEARKVNVFQHKHLEMLTLLAGQAVAAIENARLYDDLKKTQDQVVLNERLATVGEVSSDILHWVANKVGIIPRAVDNIRKSDKAVDPSLEEDLEIIDRNARSVLTLKREMLGRRERMSIGAAALVPLVEEVIAQLEFPKNVKARIVTDSPVIHARVDTPQFKKVIHYLMENGVDSMAGTKKGQLTVTIRSGEEEAVVEVADNGCGIAKEHLSQVFNSFFTTKSSKGGTGMGLWFTYRTITRMEGRIEVASELGKGTTFKIYLPIREKKTEKGQ